MGISQLGANKANMDIIPYAKPWICKVDQTNGNQNIELCDKKIIDNGSI